ncbi:MAG TPA: glycosyltransferase family 4 protein [Rhodothermales bacterium]
MRIAQVAPLAESVPPARYGGTERVVSYLTEELVRRGHDVTLFASGDSETSARLIAPIERALWRGEHLLPDIYHIICLEQLRREAHRFDIVHFHLDFWHLPLMKSLQVPYVTTMHGRLDLPDLVALYDTFPNEPLVSISDAQRTPLADLSWQGTVYNGIPADLLRPRYEQGEYLAFMGRVSPEKGLDRAIDIAIGAGRPLRISAAIQPPNRRYFEEEIEPRLDHPLVEYVGELGGSEKEEFLRHASALLFPIDWPEPFGLVMTEAMACGTPVVAFRRGSVPEVVEEGVSGFIVDDVDGAVQMLEHIEALDRRSVRRAFEARFTDVHMTDGYLDVYHRVLSRERTNHANGTGGTPLWAPEGVGAEELPQ